MPASGTPGELLHAAGIDAAAIVDSVILQGAVEVEHHEIGVYENLIINAQAMGRDDAVSLLRQNLEQEQHTLEEVKQAESRLAAVTA